jgi:hypothetical protein
MEVSYKIHNIAKIIINLKINQIHIKIKIQIKNKKISFHNKTILIHNKFKKIPLIINIKTNNNNIGISLDKILVNM